MNREEIENKYRAQGLVVEYVHDNPGAKYEPHRHERTVLFTLSGSVKLKLDNQDWITLESGQEAEVKTNQLHEAVVGNDGWEYVAAWSEEEAKRYKH